MNGRHGTHCYSADGINWTVHPRSFLDPHGGFEGNPAVRLRDMDRANDHIPSVYPYRQYYLCIYDFWYESTAIDNELAVSRDGYHFVRIANGQKLIPRGESGEWDAKCVSKAFTLVTHEDQILLYYAGLHMLETHPYNRWIGTAATGLARIPVDGWTYLRVRSDHDSGYAASIPITKSSGEKLDLVIKADHLSPGKDYILVELIDNDRGKVLPGFSREDCTPIDQDSPLQVVQWKGKKFFESDTRSLTIHFFLNGDNTRLYCFGFE